MTDDESPLAKRLRASLENSAKPAAPAPSSPPSSPKRPSKKAAPPPEPEAANETTTVEDEQEDSPAERLAQFLEQRRKQREAEAKAQESTPQPSSAPPPAPPSPPDEPPPPPPPPPPPQQAAPVYREQAAPPPSPWRWAFAQLVRLILLIYTRLDKLIGKPVRFMLHGFFGIVAWTLVFLTLAWPICYKALNGFNIFDERYWNALFKAYNTGYTIPSIFPIVGVSLGTFWLVGCTWALLHGYDFFRLRRVAIAVEHGCASLIRIMNGRRPHR